MATKVDKKKAKPAPKGAGSANAAALEVLHPNREIVIAGRALTVREYGFMEGLQVQAVAKPFFDALYQGIPRDGGAPSFEKVQDLIPQHASLVTWMVALAADVEPAWVENLDYRDGQLLLDVWWMANSGFFIQLVFRRIGLRAGENQPASSASTPPSSAPDTDARPPTSDV